MVNPSKLARFAQEHAPYLRERPVNVVEGWIKNFQSLGLAAVLLDNRRKVVALGIARPLAEAKEPSGAFDHERQDPEAIWVDLAIASERNQLEMLFKILASELGSPPMIGYQRRGSAEARFIPLQKFKKRILKRE